MKSTGSALASPHSVDSSAPIRRGWSINASGKPTEDAYIPQSINAKFKVHSKEKHISIDVAVVPY
jgi:hypothetical protein